jgi:putative aldouronate transport system substrate-binding protein
VLKKFLCVFFAAGALAVTGCGKSGGGSGAGSSGGSGRMIGNQDLSRHVEINLTVMGEKLPSGQEDIVLAELNKKLKERINTTLSMDWIDWTDYATKYNLKLASGDQIDLIFSTSTWLDLFPNARKGAFYYLEDLIPVYAPKLYADTLPEEWAQCSFDSHIVALPGHRYTQLSTPLLVYRKDWADKMPGLANGEINSIEDVETYFNAVLAGYPGVTPYVTAGSAGSNEFYSMYFRQKTKHILGPAATGMFSVIMAESYDNPFKLVNVAESGWFLDFARLTKKWGDAGYWPRDVMNLEGDSRNAIVMGTSASWIVNAAEYYTMEQKFRDGGNMDAVQGGFFFDGPPRSQVIKNVVTQDCTSVGAASQYPERCLMVYDLLAYDKEINQLANYGIEGVQYSLTADGRRTQPENYNNTLHGYQWNLWGMRNDAFLIPDVNEWAGAKALNERLFAWAVPNPYGSFVFDPAPVNAEMTAVTEVCARLGPALNFGKSGAPETAVEQFRAALKTAGIDKVLEEANRQLAQYAASLK